MEASEGEQRRPEIGHPAGEPARTPMAGSRPNPACIALVRISPFDAAARRQTSFASVWVYPVVDDSIEIEIRDADLKVDTFRASGAGGQHVNKTESAIRITHMPTGIIVACQTDRSQHRNRATAMGMLKARLYEAELQKREAASALTEAGKTENSWGHQIRNYVLAPYQLVKDLRTGLEKGNPGAVLDGDLDDFMAAALAARGGGYTQRGLRSGELKARHTIVPVLRRCFQHDMKGDTRAAYRAATTCLVPGP